MEIEILKQQCGGTEFVPQPHRLHLGAQNAEGVDRLQFILPAAWAGCTMALYLRRSDGVQLAAIPLDTDGSVTVDRRLTGSVRGQWMLAAMGSGGYTAYTRPGSYDVYATLPTDGGSEELPPSVYEQFVARVLESARAAAESARRAENGARAARCIWTHRMWQRCRSRRSLCPARWCASSVWIPPPARYRPTPPRCRTCAPMCAARPCPRQPCPAQYGQTGSTVLRCGQTPP